VRLNPARRDVPPPDPRRGHARACVFCAIVDGAAPAEVVRRWPDALALVPLNPVVPGHLLVIPVRHVPDAAADPEVTATVARRAAQLLAERGGAANLLTSIGEAGTQTVFHLHWHLVPRAAGDGLALPWSLR
jgi:histidine triad (HIT) family protein